METFKVLTIISMCLGTIGLFLFIFNKFYVHDKIINYLGKSLIAIGIYLLAIALLVIKQNNSIFNYKSQELYKNNNLNNLNNLNNINNIPNMFEPNKLSKTAYYINRDKDVSRNKHTLQLLQDIGFNDIIKIIPTIEKTPRDSLNKSHLNILNKISNFNNNYYYFIFEDDIEVTSEINRKDIFSFIQKELDELLYNYHQSNQKLPKLGFEFIYLGVCLDEEQINNCTPLNCNAYCAHAYIVTPKGAKQLLSLLPKKMSNVIDKEYVKILEQPVIGYNFTHEHTETNWRGLFYQARKADWYSSGATENTEYTW